MRLSSTLAGTCAATVNVSRDVSELAGVVRNGVSAKRKAAIARMKVARYRIGKRRRFEAPPSSPEHGLDGGGDRSRGRAAMTVVESDESSMREDCVWRDVTMNRRTLAALLAQRFGRRAVGIWAWLWPRNEVAA